MLAPIRPRCPCGRAFRDLVTAHAVHRAEERPIGRLIGELQPLVLPQLGQAWQLPARIICTPHCMQYGASACWCFAGWTAGLALIGRASVTPARSSRLRCCGPSSATAASIDAASSVTEGIDFGSDG